MTILRAGTATYVDPSTGGTAAVVHSVLKATVASGESELQLVAAQDEMAAPRIQFPVVRLR